MVTSVPVTGLPSDKAVIFPPLMTSSPYHPGELLVKQHLGERSQADRNAPTILSGIPPTENHFLAQQTLVTISSLDADGQVWTSVLLGAPSFAHSPTPAVLHLATARLRPAGPDIVWANLAARPATSLLFIEFSSRRRYRVNGRAHAVADGWQIEIDQAFLNCPQYIQPQPDPRAVPAAPVPAIQSAGTTITPEISAWITTADTFFFGSGSDRDALDTAHRGGPAGFVRVEEAGTLLVPDYVGNSMYNSLGNLALNAAAGLLFIDFAGARTLQLTGRAEVIWHLAGEEAATGGTGRWWRFTPAAWIILPLPA